MSLKYPIYSNHLAEEQSQGKKKADKHVNYLTNLIEKLSGMTEY